MLTFTASMKPRPFERGNVVARDDSSGPLGASMEPRPFERGNRPGARVNHYNALQDRLRAPLAGIHKH